MFKKTIFASLISAAAFAGEVPLPDSSAPVSFLPTQTVFTYAGVTYRGPNSLVDTGMPCAKPNTTRYHCSIQSEDVVLTAYSGAQVQLSVTVQFAATLITSGHNYWRNTTTILDGTARL